MEPWRDPSLPVEERVADLLARMTLEEKLAQMTSVWLRDPARDQVTAPLPGHQTDGVPTFAELIESGLGQLTRVIGTRPVPPAEGARTLAELQARVVAANRFGIPAIAHEECLSGFTAWTATAFPVPLAWGASFDPALVEEMAAAIGRSLRSVGVHQGLAPVLDVARDARWGRVEETIGEDPYLVGVIGTAYVRGLQSAGVIATLKHFAGYSGSRAGRNMAPVGVGRRELADVFLPPFEMAIREGGARSVMHSYAAIDGLPAAADHELLTEVLRGQLGFEGVVVADYYGISFLETLHQVAGSPAEAAAIALRAGVDVELPTVRCYGPGLAAEVRAGRLSEALVDRSAGRVLRQKLELGLLDPPGAPVAPVGEIDLDPPEHRALARRLAEESIVLLANDGSLPLDPSAHLAVVGPLADDPRAFFGCYTFPGHLGLEPSDGLGVPVVTVLEALRQELPGARIEHARGCDVRSPDRSQLATALECAGGADLVLAVLGDHAGMFGRGTSGEGCDAPDLRLPGIQADLLAGLLATGRPVVLVLVTGRPYAIENAGRLAAVVQAFFPGQEGGSAIAGVLSGRLNPGGKLPIQVPASPCAQPASYLGTSLAGRSGVSSVDPTPLFPFGHGLSYTTFAYSDLSIQPACSSGTATGALARIPTDGAVEITCTVRNTGMRAGTEVVQLYLRDPVAQVTRPVRYLAGFARVGLEPGVARRVTFHLHADRTAFCGLSGDRIVEPGIIEVEIGSSSTDPRLTGRIELEGPQRVVGSDRVLTTPVTLSTADA
ncbi:MAG TPA: glycoside hydrolase family 3 N-terminal domain-containing protein [Candidatus Dormibacteraeota bacterium]|nr:glycoside hydrolase family 3 N-terminal domain-containing protein [Candidatus Dormibacteraeota bacterium]